jgi:3-oxoacyl-[acyl-carrier protein] reductase
MPDSKSSGRKNVMVTGASRGLGLSIARHLAAAGYNVIGIARKGSDEMTAAQAEAKSAGKGEIHHIAFDLSQTGKLSGLVSDTRKQFGPLYALVNNAAIGTDGTLGIMHDSQIDALIKLNVNSPIILTKYIVRHMMADGAGRVVNISSIIGFTGYSGLSVYGATKSAMLGFTRSLSREVGRLGITVNAVAPGFMATEMTKALDDDEQQRIANRSALKRLPIPDDVARTVEFLLGDGGKNVTGTTITVDAGATA